MYSIFTVLVSPPSLLLIAVLHRQRSALSFCRSVLLGRCKFSIELSSLSLSVKTSQTILNLRLLFSCLGQLRRSSSLNCPCLDGRFTWNANSQKGKALHSSTAALKNLPARSLPETFCGVHPAKAPHCVSIKYSMSQQ